MVTLVVEIYFEGMDIGLIDHALRIDGVDPVARVGQVAGHRRNAPGHDFRGDHADLAGGVDQVVSDQELIRLAVDETSGRSAAHAFGVDGEGEVFAERIQFVIAAVVFVRGVVDHPQFAGPRDDDTDAPFVQPVAEVAVVGVVGVGCEGRIHATDEERFGRRGEGEDRLPAAATFRLSFPRFSRYSKPSMRRSVDGGEWTYFA